MRFRCSNCGHDHDVQHNSVFVDPEGGTIIGGAWYRDEHGLNHQCMICLVCGTVHSVHGSPLKGLFTMGSRMANVDFYIPPDKLQAIADGAALNASLEGLALKPVFLEALVDHGYLRLPGSEQG